MDLRQLTSGISVSPQLTVGDMAAVARAGFTNVINNRPDGEEAGQPVSERLLTAASRQGLHYSYIPISGAEIAPRDVDEFRAILERARGPVLAFCRTGTRSARLWALSMRALYPADEIIEHARRAGYDLSALHPMLLHENTGEKIQ